MLGDSVRILGVFPAVTLTFGLYLRLLACNSDFCAKTGIISLKIRPQIISQGFCSKAFLNPAKICVIITYPDYSTSSVFKKSNKRYITSIVLKCQHAPSHVAFRSQITLHQLFSNSCPMRCIASTVRQPVDPVVGDSV